MNNKRKRSVYRLDKPGNIKSLQISEEAMAPLEPREVQVSVKAIGLNFADIFAVKGLYSATPDQSFIPGLEYAGIVEAKGTGVTLFKEGDRVMGVIRFGAYADTIAIDERYLFPLPENWNFDEGASFLVQALTAHYALFELGNLQEGQSVLIHSAAGGVGLWANRMAKRYRAFTIGTVGARHKLELLEKEGYNRMLVRKKSFSSDLAEARGDQPLHLVLECIGGDILKKSYAALSPMGRLIVYGSAHYGHTSDSPNYFKLLPKYLTRPRIDPQEMIKENKSVMAFNLIYLYDHADLMHRMVEHMQTMELGKPFIGHRFTFSQLPNAIRHFQTGQTTGKVVVMLP